MDILAQERNDIPIDIDTRYHSCLRRGDSGWPIRRILSFYHAERASPCRWLSHFDGTRESLLDGSHKPKSDRPSKLGGGDGGEGNGPPQEKSRASVRRDMGEDAPRWLRDLRELGPQDPEKKRRILGLQAASEEARQGLPHAQDGSWEMAGRRGVRPIGMQCRRPPWRVCQYTILDECPGKRILYFSNGHSMCETVNALKHAYARIGCHPREIQTDNGFGSAGGASGNEKARKARPYPNHLEQFLRSADVRHRPIRPRTPEHSGKVERSHRIDQDRFYRTLRFHSLDDLKLQGLAWNRRYNDMPKVVLGFKTPNEVELEKLIQLMEDTGEMRCPKRLTSFES